MTTKNKVLTGVALSVALSASAVQAEGFFSSLFGGSKNGADIEQLFSHVPADTAYLIANKEPVPKKVLDAHMKRSQGIFSSFVNSEDFKKSMSSSGKEKSIESFFVALLQEYSVAFDKGSFEELGLSSEAHTVIYGYDMMPVVRISLADKEKFIAAIKRAEEKSKHKIDFVKCGKFDCFEATDPKGQMAIAGSILEDQIAVSVFTPDKKETMKKHLIGEADPKTSYSEATWNSFLKENNYTGYGEGFINLENAYNFAKPFIIEGAEGEMDDKSLEGCLAVAKNHIDNVPAVFFGTKSLEKDTVDYEVLLKTSAIVSTALQTIANDTNIPQRTENAIFDYGININFAKMRDALTKYTNFLIKSGEENKCPAIDPQEIRKSMGGMTMVMNMGLSQFRSMYASISDVELDENMQPKKINAVLSLGSDDPAGLVAMAGMMAPPLMSLEIPRDGSVMKLPEGIVPPSIPLDIFLSQTDSAINVFVGDDKPALKAHKNSVSEISFSSMNFKSYMKTLAGLIEAFPKDENTPDLEMLKKVGETGGLLKSTSSADERGLVINYHIDYTK